VTITTLPTGSGSSYKPGTAALTKLHPLASWQSDSNEEGADGTSTAAHIPEFVWVYDKDSKLQVFKVTSIGKDFFDGVPDYIFGSVYISPSIPALPEFTSLKPLEKGIHFVINSTWFDPITPEAGTDYSDAGKARGPFYWGWDFYVEGASEAAGKLHFGDTRGRDARDLELTAEDFAALAKAFASKSVLIEIGNSDWAERAQDATGDGQIKAPYTAAPDIALGKGALAVEGLADIFAAIDLGATVTGNLEEAGIRDFRPKAEGAAVTIKLGSVDPEKLELSGDSLFAGFDKLSIELPAVSSYITGEGEALTEIGKGWFAGSTITELKGTGAIEVIAENAFAGAKLPETSNAVALNTQFPKLEEIGAGAFAASTEEGATTQKFTGLESITALTAIGDAPFAGQTLDLGTIANNTFELPWTKLESIGSDILAGVTEGSITTIKLKEDAVLPSAIAPDAFGEVEEVIAPASVVTEWTEALETTVKPATITQSTSDYIKLTDRNGNDKEWTLDFGFTAVRRINFGGALENGKAKSAINQYSITGPRIPGFSTPKDSARDSKGVATGALVDSIIELDDVEAFLEAGIDDLQKLGLPAANYVITLYSGYASNPTVVARQVLTITPSEPDDLVSAEAIVIPFPGDIKKAAEGIADLLDVADIELLDGDGEAFALPENVKVKLSSTVTSTPTISGNAYATKPVPATVADAFKLTFSGNIKGELGIDLQLDTVVLGEETVSDVPNLPFEIAKKSYTLVGEVITISADTFEYTVKIYKDGDEKLTGDNKVTDLAYVTVKYTDDKDNKVPTSLGTHDIELTGHGFLKGTYATSFEVQAAWSSLATISTAKGDYNLGASLTFDGSVLVPSFAGLIKTDLAAGEYKLAATAFDFKNADPSATAEGLELSSFIDDSITAAGTYSFFIVPAGKYAVANGGTYKPTDATYVGFIEVAKLTKKDLEDAAVLSVVEVEAPEEGEEEAPVQYAVSFGTTYVGELASVVTVTGSKKAEENGIFVYFSEADAKSIADGALNDKGALKLGLPDGEPTTFDPIPSKNEDNVWIFSAEDETLDLWTTFKPANTPTLDWKTRITFDLSKLDAKHFSISEDGVLSADGEWSGTVNVLYTSKDGKTTKRVISIPVTAYTDTEPPTSVEAIVAGDATAVYYTLGGVAVKGTPSKGLYIVKTGDKVSKILVKD
jgi:hypothetical protein